MTLKRIKIVDLYHIGEFLIMMVIQDILIKMIILTKVASGFTSNEVLDKVFQKYGSLLIVNLLKKRL